MIKTFVTVGILSLATMAAASALPGVVHDPSKALGHNTPITTILPDTVFMSVSEDGVPQQSYTAVNFQATGDTESFPDSGSPSSVPEPATLILFSAGLLALARLRKRVNR